MQGYNFSMIKIPNNANNCGVPLYQNNSQPIYCINLTLNQIPNSYNPPIFVAQPLVNQFEIKQQFPQQIRKPILPPKQCTKRLLQKPKNKSKAKKDSRKKFRKEEDEKLRELVEQKGSKKWDLIAKEMPGRTGRQCRDRFKNYLVPGFFNGQWSEEEDRLLFKKYIEFGSQWSKITQFFPNRSANSLKNRWNYFVSKHLDVTFHAQMMNSIIEERNHGIYSKNDAPDQNSNENECNEQNNDDVFCNGIINYNPTFNYYIDPPFDFYEYDNINQNDQLDFKEDILEF